MLVHFLAAVQVAMAAALIIVGGTVEGYGYGLSLGTKWPYTKNMPSLAKAGDPEVWHRILATLLGVNSIAILVFKPSTLEITGFLLIVLTALLGMATLYVLAGKAPSVFQGLHDVLAYSTLLTYMLVLSSGSQNLGTYLLGTVPLHSFYLVIFMGGVVTGQRGFKKPIGYFVAPKTSAQWVWVIHGLSVLLFIFTLSYYIPLYNVAFLVALAQVGVGVLSYQAVNKSAARPGFLVPIHQFLTVLITLSIFFAWHFQVPLLN
jgi:hypothetical protein